MMAKKGRHSFRAVERSYKNLSFISFFNKKNKNVKKSKFFRFL